MNNADLSIFTGPIIRQGNIYRNIDKTIRRKLINRFVAFVKKCNFSKSNAKGLTKAIDYCGFAGMYVKLII